jgi:antitoxin (DNA-binding transcriptional repressor) of toxin-antitoxin stability system
MATMTVTEARAKMREAIERVKRGEEIEITQNGEVVAVWLHPSKLHYRVRTPAVIEAEEMLEEFERLRRERTPIADPGISAEEVEERTRELREERDYDAWERAREREEYAQRLKKREKDSL